MTLPIPHNSDMDNLTDGNIASLLEFAANNDIEGFKLLIERDPSGIDEIGQWYGRQKGSKQMVLLHRTPLMVAATYGSIDVMKLILSLSLADVNRSCGLDESTALHCATSGGSVNVLEAVRLLLVAGADMYSVDANGCRAVDVIVIPPKLPGLKSALEELLDTNGPANDCNQPLSVTNLNTSSPPRSPLPENGIQRAVADDNTSPRDTKFNEFLSSGSERKEYPIDPSFPDIKNSIYSTDEFRMFSFKVRPCSRAYSHDWTECPFVHPGENARRRDPRKFHYSCVPCPDFRKGVCRRNDMCEYAHGVFECWLHPAQYRTRLCKDGTSCARRVCFFAHTPDELRPLYLSTGSAVPSPRSNSSAAMDYAAAMSLLPGSPSSVSMMSPSGNGMSPHSLAWSPQNVPTLNLPGSSLQSSRLRSSLNARDIMAEEFSLLSDFDLQQRTIFNELACLSQQRSISSNSLGHSGRMNNLTPSNLEDLFSTENSSPRYSDQAFASAGYSPTHNSAAFNHFQQQQSVLSPINTSFSPKNVDHPLLQTAFGGSSSGRMSPRNVDPISPMGSRISMLSQREKQQNFRSLSSRELGTNSNLILGSPIHSMSKWGPSTGKPDWTLSANEFGRLRRSSSFEQLGINGEESDFSWVQSLVKDSSTEVEEKATGPAPTPGSAGVAGASSSTKGSNLDSQVESGDHAVLGAWLEKMQIDQLVTE